ncbi:MAG: DUF4192 domain-containing protein [Kineosporiaceae bacterium]
MHTIVAGDPADLIAYAYYRIGFRPRESVVVIGLARSGAAPAAGYGAGPAPSGRMQVGMVARLDLPPVRDRRQAFEHLARLMVDQGQDAAIALLISTRPADALVKAWRRASRAVRLAVLDVITVDDHSYRSRLCRDAACCPPEGVPLASVFAGRVAADLVSRGHALVENAEDLVADVVPRDPLPEQLFAEVPDPTPDRFDRLRRWGQLVAEQGEPAPAEIDSADLVDLCRGLDDVAFRDAVLVAMSAPTGDDGLGSARLMVAGEAERAMAEANRHDPDEDLLDRSRRVLAAVARRAPRGRRAEALGVLAWAAWWRGESVQARLLAERALQDQPRHRLSHLVLGLVNSCIAPPWVTRRRALIS